MPEWFNGAAWKAVARKGPVGSNPTSSAYNKISSLKRSIANGRSCVRNGHGSAYSLVSDGCRNCDCGVVPTSLRRLSNGTHQDQAVAPKKGTAIPVTPHAKCAAGHHHRNAVCDT